MAVLIICVGLMFWIKVVVAFLMFCLLPFGCLSRSLGVCVSGGIVVGVSGLFLWVADGFLCRVLCISVLSLSRYGLLRFRYKGQSLIEDLLFSCCEYFLLRLTIVSVVLGC